MLKESLIIRIVDHRSVAPTTSTSSTTSSTDDTNRPFSIHNWNEHLLPSPYVPFPAKPPANTQPPQPSSDADPVKTDATDAEEPAPVAKEPKVFTTVLHPTPLSLMADMTILASTPDPRSLNRRQSQGFPARTPASATMPQPPTPLSAVPQTPVNDRGPPAKKQKMILEPKDFHDYESRVINAVAPPLFLESVDDSQEADEVMKLMRSELHSRDPPLPKTRKRTVAELAADEALAAEEERFILIMDERLGTGTAGAAAAGSGDGQAGTAFEPRFNRFKTLESIKLQQEEAKKRELERKIQLEHQRRQQQQEEAERAKQQLVEQRNRENELRAAAARRQQVAAQQMNQQGNVPPQVNGIMPSMHQQPNMMHVSQGQHSSPVVRTQTPQHSSPMISSMMGTHPGQSVPMNVTSSNQGAGSPPRPGSALQHPHPGVAAAMAQSMSQNRSQQGPSRNGTPQMPQATPAMQHATPVMRQVSTPTPRMSHGSPVGSTVAQTPAMQPGMMQTPQMNNQALTHHQVEMMRRQQAQQAAMQQHQQQNMQNLNGRPMNPQQMTALQQQQFMQQQGLAQQHGFNQQQMQSAQYQNAVRAAMEAQMRGASNQQQFPNQQLVQMAHGSPPHPGMAPQHMPNGMPGVPGQAQAQLPPVVRQRAHYIRQQMLQSAQQQHGPNLSPELIQNISRRAQSQAIQDFRQSHMARASMAQQQAAQQARAVQMQQQQQQHNMMGGQ
jgi:transcription factor SPT20